MIEIEVINGVKKIKIERFKALDGWDIQRDFIEFAATKDKQFRREFTLRILTYAKIILADNQELPLITDALIDNHLQSWENVEKVFENILLENGIDPKTHADKVSPWGKAGADMAVSFVAEVTNLLGPALVSISGE